MFVTFVRHMETDWNKEKRFTAQAFPFRLNAQGIAQAERMASLLESIGFTSIFCSHQIRAIETAIIIAAKQDQVTRFTIDPRLREVSVGSLMGLHQADVIRPEFRTDHPQFDFREVGGERKDDVIARQREFLEEILLDHRDHDEALVVGHGTALRALFEHLSINEKLTREKFVRVDLQKMLSVKIP